jgi:hypothetical protein
MPSLFKYSAEQVESAVDHFINLNTLPLSILSTDKADDRPRVWQVSVTNGGETAVLNWLEDPGVADVVRGEIYRDGVRLGHF